MTAFRYEARDQRGQLQQGIADAGTASGLATSLRERGWLVLDVQREEPAGDGAGMRLADWNPFLHLPPRSLDIELSLQQLAVMLRGGLTLLSALETLVEQSQKRTMQRVWREVSGSIQEGASLAEAMSHHRCFSRLVIQLTRVGEQTGNLEQVLVRAADILANRRQTRTSLMTAAAYPSIVLVSALGVSGFMVVSVIPKLQVFLTALGRKLPAMTQFLVDLGAWIQAYGMQTLLVLGALLTALIATYLWPPGRYFLDRLVLRIPVVGNLLRVAATAMFARSVATLIRSGVTLLEGLRTVEQLHQNRYLREQVMLARDAVMRGQSLAQPLASRAAFMPMLAAMVAVGESTGTLDDVLDEVAEFHDERLRTAIRQFSVIIEPVIIVVVGSIVGFVYISFFLAMFSAAGAVR
jgi:type II secretory pathway component PulF